MRVVLEKQVPDGPSSVDMFIRYVCVFAIGLLVGMMAN